MLVLTGSVDDINTALNGLQYQPSLNYNGADTLSITTNDLGHNGTGDAQSDTDNVAITVSAVNDAPVNTVPLVAQSVNEDTELVFNLANSNRITIADIDAASSSVQVTLSVDNGTLTLPSTSGLAFTTGDGSADAMLVFTGSIADINTALNGLSYQPSQNYNGADTLTITTDDLGNTGTGDAQSDTDNVAITVSAVNDAPVNTVPDAQSVNEDTMLVFSSANVNQLRLLDVDAAASDVKVTLSVEHGTLSLANTTGLTFTTGDGSADAMLVFTGSIADINTALNGLQYQPNQNYNGSDTLSFTTDDQGNSGIGGAQSDSDNVAITVSAVNDAPVNTVPLVAQSVNEDTELVFSSANAVSISDVDADSSPVQVAVNVANGTLTLQSTTGLTFSAGDGISDGAMTFTGSVADVNAAMNGLRYNPNPNYNGPDTLNITTSDQGNSGAGEILTDTDNVSITVNAVNDAPVNTVPGNSEVNEDTTLAFSSANSNGITIADPDAGSSLIQVTLSVDNGTLTLPSTTGLTFITGDGSEDAMLVFTGSIADINTALNNGLSYLPNANYYGSDTLTITTSDQGNSGAGGTLYDTDNVTITVNSVNDDPTISGILDQPIDEDDATNLLSFTVLDAETAAGSLDVSATSDNLALVPLSGITLGGSDKDRTITITPAANQFGTATITLTVTDANGGSNQQTFTVNVASVNDAPVNTVPEAQSVNEDTALEFNSTNGKLISISDVDADSSDLKVTLSVEYGTLTLATAAGLTFITGDGSEDAMLVFTGSRSAINTALDGLSYQPSLNYNGPDTLTITTDDQGFSGAGGPLSDLDSVAITVNAVNDAPVAVVDDDYSTNEDTPLNATRLSLLGNDYDPEGAALTWEVVANSGPLHGQVIINQDESFTYIPESNYNGPDSFDYRVFDGELWSEPVTVTINVASVNDAPTVTAATEATINYNSQAEVISFTIKDDDGPVGNLDISTPASSNSTLIPSSNIVLGGSDGSRTLSITPAVNQSGTAVISFTVSDGAGGETTHEITVTVREQSPWKAGVLGDVNGDGIVSWTDIDAIEAALGINSSLPVDPNGPTPSEPYLDVNGDWVVDQGDVAFLELVLSDGGPATIAQLHGPFSGNAYQVQMTHTPLRLVNEGSITFTFTLDGTPYIARGQDGYQEIDEYVSVAVDVLAFADPAEVTDANPNWQRVGHGSFYPEVLPETYNFTVNLGPAAQSYQRYAIRIYTVGGTITYDPDSADTFDESALYLEAELFSQGFLTASLDTRSFAIVNDDDDNNNLVVDMQETGISNDDDLEALSIQLHPQGNVDYNEHYVTIQSSSGLPLWMDAQKQVPFSTGAPMLASSVPSTLFVEATSPGAKSITIDVTNPASPTFTTTCFINAKELHVIINNQVAGIAPIDVLVGDRINAGISIADPKTIEWTIPGKVFEKYEVAPDKSSATVNSVSVEEKQRPNVVYHWIDAAAGRKVDVTVTLSEPGKPDKVTTRSANFHVNLPKGDGDADVTIPLITFGQAMFVDVNAGTEADTAQYNLILARRDSVSGEIMEGIEMLGTKPVTGELQWVQLVDGEAKWIPRQEGGTTFVKHMEGLDNKYPYTSGERFTDSPSMYAYSTPGALWDPSDPTSSPNDDLWKTVSYNTHFHAVLMFRPSGGDWVPLRYVDWTFDAIANYYGPVAGWQIDWDNSSVGIDSATTEHPVWTTVTNNF
jgi:hypothetical protein